MDEESLTEEYRDDSNSLYELFIGREGQVAFDGFFRINWKEKSIEHVERNEAVDFLHKIFEETPPMKTDNDLAQEQYTKELEKE